MYVKGDACFKVLRMGCVFGNVVRPWTSSAFFSFQEFLAVETRKLPSISSYKSGTEH